MKCRRAPSPSTLGSAPFAPERSVADDVRGDGGAEDDVVVEVREDGVDVPRWFHASAERRLQASASALGAGRALSLPAWYVEVVDVCVWSLMIA